jgi:hypothetical protein
VGTDDAVPAHVVTALAGSGDLIRVEEYREAEPWWCGPICPASTG